MSLCSVIFDFFFLLLASDSNFLLCSSLFAKKKLNVLKIVFKRFNVLCLHLITTIFDNKLLNHKFRKIKQTTQNF